jgi:16S rRNA (cytosine1402-N4)-methyltransferase
MSPHGEAAHIPVMREEAVGLLSCRSGGRYVDGTLGEGGYAESLLESSAPDGLVLGLDWDAVAIERSGARLARYGDRIRLVHASYAQLRAVLEREGWERVDGIVLDLGISSAQLDDPVRGFSLVREGPLDMRMDRTLPRTAADLVNTLGERDLVRLIRDLGEERWARRIAGAIVSHRMHAGFSSTLELAELIRRTVPPTADSRRIHPATRTFQALRLAVNQELEGLEQFLATALDVLNEGGRLCIVSFHSLEDRIVKRAFKAWATRCQCPPEVLRCTCARQARARLLTKKVLRPSEEEVARNPRARSARLRAIEKITDSH